MAKIRLDSARDAIRNVEELLTDIQAALEDGDADAAKEALDEFLVRRTPTTGTTRTTRRSGRRRARGDGRRAPGGFLPAAPIRVVSAQTILVPENGLRGCRISPTSGRRRLASSVTPADRVFSWHDVGGMLGRPDHPRSHWISGYTGREVLGRTHHAQPSRTGRVPPVGR